MAPGLLGAETAFLETGLAAAFFSGFSRSFLAAFSVCVVFFARFFGAAFSAAFAFVALPFRSAIVFSMTLVGFDEGTPFFAFAFVLDFPTAFLSFCGICLTSIFVVPAFAAFFFFFFRFASGLLSSTRFFRAAALVTFFFFPFFLEATTISFDSSNNNYLD